ncbi:hypothetical protein [Geminocystis herdmanii]|uniref:hypothetical protein n=1 Tax=Geminocystis herdmanii TaxID=669359 RepID=UPI00034BF1FE|nr:hypothetical protein [Geminocystis herdmanii]
MSQFPHDEFIKEYLPELYQDYGIVTPSADVMSEKREIDVLFTPTKPVPTTPETLGLLGKLAQTTCLLEIFRNAVNNDQIMDCIGKLITVRNNLLKSAKKEPKNQETSVFLWIITPTISDKILTGFNANTRENWEKGVYFLPPTLCTGIIAIHQLPISKNTLWLRILGKGKTQVEAIEELKTLPLHNPHRETILELVYGLLDKLETKQRQKQGLIKEDETLIMSLRQIYRDKMAEVEQQGKLEGEKEGKLKTVPLLRQLGMNVEEIATRLELPLEDVINASNSPS